MSFLKKGTACGYHTRARIPCPYFLKVTSNSAKYRKNVGNKCPRRVPFLVKPFDYIKHATVLNSELSQSYVFQEFCPVFKNTKFPKKFLMVALAINHLRILWSMMTESKAAFSRFL